MSLTLVNQAKPEPSSNESAAAEKPQAQSPATEGSKPGAKSTAGDPVMARRQRRGKRREDCLQLTETPLEIRFADVDMMRVVHHSAYLHWFEKIRFNALRNVFDISFESLESAGLMLPLTSCQVNYLRPFRFTQQPVGYAEIEVYKRAMFTVHYFVFCRESGRLHTTGLTHHCYLNRDARLLLNTPPQIRQAFDRVVAQYPEWVRHGDGPNPA